MSAFLGFPCEVCGSECEIHGEGCAASLRSEVSEPPRTKDIYELYEQARADLEAANRERERLQAELDAIDEENVALVQKSIPRVRDAIEAALQQVVHAYSTDIENAVLQLRKERQLRGNLQ